MRRPISWIDKEAPEGKVEIRVSFHGDAIKWQFQDAGTDFWVYDRRPTEEQWQQLEEKVANLLQRGHFFQSELELVKRRGATKSGK